MFSFRHLFTLRQMAMQMGLRRSVQRLSSHTKWEQHSIHECSNVRLLSTSEYEKLNEFKNTPEKPVSNTFLCITHILESTNKGGKEEAEKIFNDMVEGYQANDEKRNLKAVFDTLESVIVRGDVHWFKHLQILQTCKEFRGLLEKVFFSLSNYNEHDLLNLLNCQLTFRIYDKTREAKLWENVLPKSNKLNISGLIRLHHMSKNSKDNSLQNQIAKQIARRWMEIEKVNELISVMKIMILESKKSSEASVFDHLEEKALQKAETLNLEEITQVLFALRASGRRNLPLIKSLAYCMKKKMSDDFPLKSTASVFTSISKLNFHDAALLGLLSDHAVMKVNGVQEKKEAVNFLSIILMSCAHLRWFPPNLEKTIQSHFEEFPNHLNPVHLCFAICNMSKLHSFSESEKEMVRNMVAKLEEKEIEKSHPVVWLNLALALGWNDCSVDWVLSSVLKQDFVDNIQKNFPTMVSVLRQLDYEASFAFPNFQGPRLDLGGQKPERTNTKQDSLVTDVIDITHVLDKQMDESVQTRIMTSQGHEIDALVLVGNDKRVVPFSSSGSNFHKVAIKVLKFQDMIQPGVVPTSENRMWVRHMQSLGYKLVVIPYNEWKSLPGNNSKMMYLEKKITESIS